MEVLSFINFNGTIGPINMKLMQKLHHVCRIKINLSPKKLLRGFNEIQSMLSKKITPYY